MCQFKKQNKIHFSTSLTFKGTIKQKGVINVHSKLVNAVNDGTCNGYFYWKLHKHLISY